jgi:hypothetical protein
MSNYQTSQKRTSGNHFPKNSLSSQSNHFISGRALCQICGKIGHQALDCFYRMNHSL